MSLLIQVNLFKKQHFRIYKKSRIPKGSKTVNKDHFLFSKKWVSKSKQNLILVRPTSQNYACSNTFSWNLSAIKLFAVKASESIKNIYYLANYPSQLSKIWLNTSTFQNWVCLFYSHESVKKTGFLIFHPRVSVKQDKCKPEVVCFSKLHLFKCVTLVKKQNFWIFQPPYICNKYEKNKLRLVKRKMDDANLNIWLVFQGYMVHKTENGFHYLICIYYKYLKTENAGFFDQNNLFEQLVLENSHGQS